MAKKHAASGEIVDVAPLGQALANTPSSTLVRAEHFEVFRMVLPAGKATPMHEASGLITIQCLEGRVELEAHGRTQALKAGQLVYLSDAEPHAVRGIEDSALLVTVVLHRQ